jgi:DNA-binding beta-propeller fold protein YncE
MKSIGLFAVALAFGSAAQAAELELIQTIPLKGKAGGLDHVALDAKRDRLLIANKANNTLDIVDLKAGSLLKQVPNQTGIQGIAYAPEVDRVYVGLDTNGLCNVFDAESYKPVKTISFKEDADNVRYNPKTGLVYVAHAPNALGVVSAKTNIQKPDVKLPGPAEAFVLEKDRSRGYIACPSPSQVIVIDTDKNEVITSYPVKAASAAHPIALDEAAHRVYLGCRKEPKIVIVDTESGKETGDVAIPGDIDDLYLDTAKKKLYAACGEGFVAVLKADGDKVEVIEKVPTAKGAKTCLYLPESGKLYLAVPRQEGKDGPEIRVYQAK